MVVEYTATIIYTRACCTCSSIPWWCLFVHQGCPNLD